jgi:hypothetical protein
MNAQRAFKPRCVPIAVAPAYAKVHLVRVAFARARLTVDVESESATRLRLAFGQPVGFRVLDERELCEFWPEHSTSHGWLYEVLEGGWLELERQRSNYTDFVAPVREFMIADDYCVNVISTHPPTIKELSVRRKELNAGTG